MMLKVKAIIEFEQNRNEEVEDTIKWMFEGAGWVEKCKLIWYSVELEKDEV